MVHSRHRMSDHCHAQGGASDAQTRLRPVAQGSCADGVYLRPRPYVGVCEGPERPTRGTTVNNPLTTRASHIHALAATLPEPTRTELLHPADDGFWPEYAPTQIVPGLYQGGTEDDDVLSVPRHELRRRGSYPFDTVVTLYASAQPAPWGVEELRFGFFDASLQGGDVRAVLRAARFAYQRWASGADVLIRCQAGMNRSGLVTALVLIRAGLTPGQAISLIRHQRGQTCLFNQHFVTWLLDHGAEALTDSTPNAA